MASLGRWEQEKELVTKQEYDDLQLPGSSRVCVKACVQVVACTGSPQKKRLSFSIVV